MVDEENTNSNSNEEVQAPPTNEPQEQAAQEVQETEGEQNVTQEAQQETQEETPEITEQPPEQEVVEQTESKDEASQQPSRREQLRIQQLLKKYGPPQERPKTSPDFKREDALDYEKAFDLDADTLQKLKDDRRAAEESSYNRAAIEARQEAAASEWRVNLKIDYPLIKDKLEKLDPVDVQALEDEYLLYSGFDPATGYVDNPNISYADFVGARIEQSERLAARMNVQSAKNIAQQTAQTGLRPDGSSAKTLDLSKHPSDMTDEELAAAIKANMRDKKPV